MVGSSLKLWWYHHFSLFPSFLSLRLLFNHRLSFIFSWSLLPFFVSFWNFLFLLDIMHPFPFHICPCSGPALLFFSFFLFSPFRCEVKLYSIITREYQNAVIRYCSSQDEDKNRRIARFIQNMATFQVSETLKAFQIDAFTINRYIIRKWRSRGSGKVSVEQKSLLRNSWFMLPPLPKNPQRFCVNHTGQSQLE